MVIVDINAGAVVDAVVAADEPKGQQGVVGDGSGLGAVGERCDLSGRIPSRAALGFPLRGRVAGRD